MLFMGVEPVFLILNVTLLLLGIVVFKLKGLVFIVVTYIVHKLLQSISKNDVFTRHIYTAYHFQADRYEPWPESQPKRGHRPIDLGRGMVK